MEEKIRAIASFNALEHDGKADSNSVVSKVVALFPDERKNLKSLIPRIREIVEEVNSLSKEEMSEIVKRDFPELLATKARDEEKRLPDLPNVEKGGVVMRMAPSPSGPLHIGHARMAILNDEYLRRYGGKLILRIEDTNPANIELDAYQMIQEDLRWLGVNFTDLVIQSKRFDLYYSEMKKLIEAGNAYVATTPTEEFKSNKQRGLPIRERDETPEENLERWEKMVSGGYEKGEVYAVVKTDLNHPNPAIRDFIAFRVIDTPHPLEGDKYRAYPMMNFSVAVDDHYLGLTHVIRGKDHIANTEKQKYIFGYRDWKLPYYLHYGKVSIEHTILKTSLIKKGIRSGEFSGWDDPKLGTLVAFKKRGFDPLAIRKYYVESGIGSVDTTFSWEIFYSFNRKIIDSRSPRHFFVNQPISLKFDFEGTLRADIPLFPQTSQSGEHRNRSYTVGKGTIIITSQDHQKFDGELVRLKDLGFFKIESSRIEYIGASINEDVQKWNPNKPLGKVPIIHWLSGNEIPFKVTKPDGSEDTGLIERDAINYLGTVHQFERYGYVNVLNEKEGYFTHP
ncbi:MAG: glutamate--tRNA ligase [Candidatus Thermoplasmatota archaeon]|nr:glutamate--tRNA ligase [Candidatus Thermoplasmatota archaeon]